MFNPCNWRALWVIFSGAFPSKLSKVALRCLLKSHPLKRGLGCILQFVSKSTLAQIKVRSKLLEAKVVCEGIKSVYECLVSPDPPLFVELDALEVVFLLNNVFRFRAWLTKSGDSHKSEEPSRSSFAQGWANLLLILPVKHLCCELY